MCSFSYSGRIHDLIDRYVRIEQLGVSMFKKLLSIRKKFFAFQQEIDEKQKYVTGKKYMKKFKKNCFSIDKKEKLTCAPGSVAFSLETPGEDCGESR